MYIVYYERGFAGTPCMFSWESDGGTEKGPLMLLHSLKKEYNGVTANPLSHVSSPWKPSETTLFVFYRVAFILHFLFHIKASLL